LAQMAVRAESHFGRFQMHISCGMIWRAFFAQRICDETCRRGVERISFACASTARPRDRLDGMEFERANRSKLGCRMGAQKLVRYSDKIAACVKQTQKSTGLTSRLLLVSTGWLFGFRRSIAATRRVRSQARRGECSTRSAPNTCPVEGAALQDGKTAEPIVCPLVRVELARLPVDMFVVGGDAPIRAARTSASGPASRRRH
jgi:hypothetical protein